MIEINLPTEAAISLLNDQFVLEFKRQRKLSKNKSFNSIEELSDSEFKKILEISLFDILSLLPVTLITEESNLPEIISKSVKGLAYKYYKPSFYKFSEKNAKSILLIVKKSFGNFSSTTTFQNN
ncbi:MAG: hypothetical protein C4543_00590 [Ignavibacteriales bacterium]|jgi:hypothetical protein|nr:MAG: hypothetical protein C4543_00590 [Ignavibacteriales bacterium]